MNPTQTYYYNDHLENNPNNYSGLELDVPPTKREVDRKVLAIVLLSIATFVLFIAVICLESKFSSRKGILGELSIMVGNMYGETKEDPKKFKKLSKNLNSGKFDQNIPGALKAFHNLINSLVENSLEALLSSKENIQNILKDLENIYQEIHDIEDMDESQKTFITMEDAFVSNGFRTVGEYVEKFLNRTVVKQMVSNVKELPDKTVFALVEKAFNSVPTVSIDQSPGKLPTFKIPDGAPGIFGKIAAGVQKSFLGNKKGVFSLLNSLDGAFTKRDREDRSQDDFSIPRIKKLVEKLSFTLALELAILKGL